MTQTHLRCAAAAGALIFASQANAQTGNSNSSPTEAATAFDTSAGPGFLLPGIQLNADVQGGKTVQLTLDHRSDLTSDNRGEIQLGATFTAPFDKDENRGDLFTRGRVPSGFAAEGSFTVSLGLGSSDERQSGNEGRHDVNSGGSGSTTDQPGQWLPTRYLILHGTVGINVDNFKFRDATTFDPDHRWRTGVSGSAAIGYMPNGRTFFAIGASYGRTYEAPAKRILCQAAAPTPFECVQDVFAPPTRSNAASIYGLVRHVRPFGPRVPIAAELRVTYDISNRLVTVETPLYVFLDSDHHYRGGVRVAWDSDHRGVGVGVFIGVPFNLFGL